MRSLIEYKEMKKRVRPRFSSGELVKLLSADKEQYLVIVYKKKNGIAFYYGGDILEADREGKLTVVRRTYDVAEDQLSRIPGVRHKK